VGQISVAEAARRLGVGVARVHQRIADGSLPATRIGAQWVIEEAALIAVSERVSGRPLSRRSARALIALSLGDQDAIQGYAPAERSRARERLQRLLAPSIERSEAEVHALAVLLRAWLGMRAERRRYRVSPGDLTDLRKDGRLVQSGVSHPRSGISAGDVIEGYVGVSHIDEIVLDYLLSSVTSGREANVILHVVADGMPRAADVHGLLVLAADLVEHRGPREEARAFDLLRQLAQEHPEFAVGDRSTNGGQRS
jgi:excisionase family DNA binding protein